MGQAGPAEAPVAARVPPARQVTRHSLGEQVLGGVLDLIGERGLRPGDTLPAEGQLAADFGVSRPIVREALRALAERGVVKIVNGRGAVLVPLDNRPLSAWFERAVTENAGAVTELMWVRRGIEVQAARLAAEHATAAQLDALGRTAATMRAALGDPDRYIDLDTQFHLELAEATGNTLIVHLMQAIREILRGSVSEGFRSRTDPAHIETAHARHETLVADLRRRDADAAAATMEAHFDDAIASLSAAAFR
jgi:GntR family transcriptional repressor for pyruvate dehydrogenase complex